MTVVNTPLLPGGSTPLIVLLFSGGPLNISFMDSDPSVSAILHCFLPAQATGDAIRHAILNDVTGAVPAGRSPYTWPVYFEQVCSQSTLFTVYSFKCRLGDFVYHDWFIGYIAYGFTFNF